ncbi:hypothetical protein BLNAU_4296 [Blattamonas nauphoetae]|uniref:Uncharacterized protein n=1 Tax=Blattamonas nauphoetae TaxID=2049346 RepID=A0ABQ9YA29_9EUKA|nr:hypothetical protein BLNAU_4296 [Blattamonas nauphoetae]
MDQKRHLSKRELSSLPTYNWQPPRFNPTIFPMMKTSFQEPFPPCVSSSMICGYESVFFRVPNFQTIYLNKYALPGFLTRVDLRFGVALIQNIVEPRSFQTFHVAAESLSDAECLTSCPTNPPPSTSARVGRAADSVRYCGNGALILTNQSVARSDPWKVHTLPENPSYGFVDVGLEIDLRHDRPSTLRVFVNKEEQRTVFYDVPRCPMRISVRLGEKNSTATLMNIGHQSEGTEMQSWLFYQFRKWEVRRVVEDAWSLDVMTRYLYQLPFSSIF